MSGWKLTNPRQGYVYHQVYIDGKGYLSHRVVYAMRTGNPNPVEIDHIDQDSSNNHPFNLREATRSAQCINKTHPNATGDYRGVSKRANTWSYEIRRRSLGLRLNEGGFVTEHEAYLARQEMLVKLGL